MRNLRNIRFGRCRRPDVTAACWDPETDQVLCTAGPTAQSTSIELLRLDGDQNVSHHIVAKWDASSPNPDLPVDRVVSLQYLSGSATTCLVLEGGDIITVQGDESVDDAAHLEIVGSIDDGIAAARWSPDEELLAVVTKTGSVIFMGATFDPVTEVSMTVDDLKASKHVSVGWGKRETQFQGRGAKALRDPTIPEKVDQGVPSPYEDGATTISWRGDGAYVAINAVEHGARRVIRVYSREGELDSASEPVDGFESSLSWRPEGNLMAGTQRFSDRVDVVFFERNGLRHGQFTLRSPTGPVTAHEKIRLEWNSDSTVLAVIFKDMIQLWTTGNYHWYLKQEMPISSDSSCLAWHPEKALRFAAASTDDVILTEYIFHTARGSCRPSFDNGAVAVIDGESVKLTPFRTANVPPPMSMFEISAASAVVDVAFGYQNTTFAVLHRNGIDTYKWPMKYGRSIKPQLVKQAPFKPTELPVYHVPLRITPSFGYKFHCCEYLDQDCVYSVLETESSDTTGLSVIDHDHDILATTSYEDGSVLEGYGQDNSGKLYRITDSGNELLPVQFPTQLPWFEISMIYDDIVAFGLSRNGHIYANSYLLAKNCTSFIVTPSHLIFTTNNHLVKFVHLSADIDELEVPADDPEKDERCRSVERGSRLVTAIPTNMSLVFQMPRGNLETIFPRAMVVAGIRNLIDEKNYARAFSYCRTQRVDMNILYDHQPDQFLANVGVFLDQIPEVTYVDLFLSSLRPEDVTQTMYQDTKPTKVHTAGILPTNESTPAPKSSAAKVNAICNALLKGLQNRKDTHLQNIITAHVCKSPPALDDGLTLVADLMQEDEKLAEKAVEHICFLVDVNRLYEHALGLYNLDLALLVAQQSQRDPREYLPFIQNLHKLSELRRKFEIDDHLARREKALLHLQTLDAFDELVAYTTQHALYHDALRLYRYDQLGLRTLTGAYAEYLESTSAYREAGLAYESLQNYTKATNCYRTAGATCWQECLYTAQQQEPPISADALNELATALADALWEAKDYTSAATIYLETLNAVDTAVKCLCKGYHFAEAIRIVLQRSRPDLLTTAVDVGLAEALGSTTEFLADCKAQLNAQVPRIAELRRKAAEDPLAFYEGERGGGLDIPDDVSVASSRVSTSASLFTRYTGKAGSVGTAGTGVSRATSKNRRREEKKRARGRKGTVYEEEYLVNSVRRLVERVNATTPDVERLVFALVRRSMPERARAAEALMADVSGTCARIVAEVFAPVYAEQQPEQPGGEPTWRATGGDAVLQDFVLERAKKPEPPPVMTLKKLTLLGS
ncbi:putative elongator complex protein 1 [Neonectria punicea]|uniref:Elongator complex protein 1 n=1 Tax=Neonectria punicea TaxID=979145 RepID=A0ABR1HU65_9HYPO